MNGEQLTAKHNDLVEEGTHGNIAGISREEKGCIRGWKTQGSCCCERFLGCDEGLLLLCLPQERLRFACKGSIQGSHGVGKNQNKMMIIIYCSHKFLELLDECRAWGIGDCVDF